MPEPPDSPPASLPTVIGGLTQEDIKRLNPFRPKTESELIDLFFGDIQLQFKDEDRIAKELQNAKDFVSGFPSAGIDTFSGTDTQVYVVLYGKEYLVTDESIPPTILDDTLTHRKTIPSGEGLALPPPKTGIKDLDAAMVKNLHKLANGPSNTLAEDNLKATAQSILNTSRPIPELKTNGIFIRKIADAQTFTLSTFREKPSVRALGNISVRGHARGGRTCAGTIIFTDFFFPSIYEFLIPQDGDSGTSSGAYTLLDQIPPFDVILYRRNEFGLASYQFVSGLEFITTGKVISVHDMFTEKTVSYKAIDFSEEIPANWKAVKNRLNSLAWKTALAGGNPGKNATKIITKFTDEWDSRNRRLV